MNEDCLKLTIYFGERDRAKGAFLADALLDLFGEHALQTSVLLRGAEGFGAKQRLQTQRLLTLSEDLPVVAVAVDSRERIERLLPAVTALTGDGLVTLERARMLTGEIAATPLTDEATKLTVYCGRQERANGRPAFLEVVDLLHRRGIAGATVLLGVDGTAHGERRRARFFGRNEDVPLMVVSVGDGERVAAVLPELGELLERPLVTLERLRVCKRDGQLLAVPHQLPAQDPAGLALWHKLMVYTSEQARHGRHPLHVELIRRLRREGAPGATALRGVWGFHGDHPPHGDRLLSLRRHVPVVTVLVDTPERSARWFELVDELTDASGPRNERDRARGAGQRARAARGRPAARGAHAGMSALWVFVPALGAAILHGPVLALDLFKPLKRPLDFGATLGGERLFGDNKTWRGAIFMTAGVVAAAALLSLWPWYWHKLPQGIQDAGPLPYGLLLGLSVVLGELPEQLPQAPPRDPAGRPAPRRARRGHLDLRSGRLRARVVAAAVAAVDDVRRAGGDRVRRGRRRAHGG